LPLRNNRPFILGIFRVKNIIKINGLWSRRDRTPLPRETLLTRA
jgi:hypothetical protein